MTAALERLRAALHRALGALPPFQRCALVGYPCHANIGDHLIWLAQVDYLRRERQAEIVYAASHVDFRPDALRALLRPGDPLFVAGGGNFGDLWPRHQRLTLRAVEAAHGRPVYLFPQTVFFARQAARELTRHTLARHGNVVLFVRDGRSLEAAERHFPELDVRLCPDMAFHFAGRLSPASLPGKGTLHLLRRDKERGIFRSQSAEDWVSYRLPNLARLAAARLAGRPTFPYRKTFEGDRFFPLVEESGPYGNFHALSFRLAEDGASQLGRAERIVTDRLHAHILASLLGKPTVLLANAYFKNEAHFETWGGELPLARFGAEAVS
jgi:exopolysaccharide biosynthesis predicted pyruvyltransferase EpsI